MKRLSNLAVASADQAVKSLEACVRSFESAEGSDAKSGEGVSLEPAEGASTKSADRVAVPAAVRTGMRRKVLAVGDGVDSYISLFTSLEDICIASKGFAYPSAESLLWMANDMASPEHFVNPDQVTPLYLRHLDARPLTPTIT